VRVDVGPVEEGGAKAICKALPAPWADLRQDLRSGRATLRVTTEGILEQVDDAIAVRVGLIRGVAGIGEDPQILLPPVFTGRETGPARARS